MNLLLLLSVVLNLSGCFSSFQPNKVGSNGKNYYFEDSLLKSYSGAESECSNRGGRLAMFETEADWNAVKEIIGKLAPGVLVFIFKLMMCQVTKVKEIFNKYYQSISCFRFINARLNC